MFSLINGLNLCLIIIVLIKLQLGNFKLSNSGWNASSNNGNFRGGKALEKKADEIFFYFLFILDFLIDFFFIFLIFLLIFFNKVYVIFLVLYPSVISTYYKVEQAERAR